MSTTPTTRGTETQAENTISAADSTAGSRFDRVRGAVGIWGSLPLLICLYVIPLPLENQQQALLAVMATVTLLWLTEAVPIPVTALVGLALLVVLGVAPPDEIFGAFGSVTVFLVIGAFLIARAMTVHGLDRRFALSVLSLPRVGNSTYLTVLAFGGVALTISGFVSSSATAAMLLPIGLGIANTVGAIIVKAYPGKKVSQLRFSCLVMLAIAYGASIGGLLTPVSGPANLVGRGLIEQHTGNTISFIDWMLVTIPFILVMGVIMAVVLCIVNRPEVRHIPGGQELFRAQRAQLGKMSSAECSVLLVFGGVVTLWVAPSLVEFFGVTSDPITTVADRLNEGAVPVIGAGLLFFLPAGKGSGRKVLTWQEAASIDWGTILLVGAGLTIGTMMSQTGLATTVGTGLSEATGVNSLLALTILAAVFGLLISETVSNTASVGIVLPIILPIATAIGVAPMVPAMAAIIAASSGAMLPIATPPNAIVYGSGMVPLGRMVRSGVICDLIGVALIVVTAMTVMVAVFS